jgi:hypothetical protein
MRGTPWTEDREGREEKRKQTRGEQSREGEIGGNSSVRDER